MSNPDKFGRLVRQKRKDAKKTLADLAGILGVSIVYVSDVERGKRPPWRPDLIIQAANFLGVDPQGLLVAAAAVRGSFQLDASHLSPEAAHAGAALMRGWEELTDQDLIEIRNIVERRLR